MASPRVEADAAPQPVDTSSVGSQAQDEAALPEARAPADGSSSEASASKPAVAIEKGSGRSPTKFQGEGQRPTPPPAQKEPPRKPAKVQESVIARYRTLRLLLLPAFLLAYIFLHAAFHLFIAWRTAIRRALRAQRRARRAAARWWSPAAGSELAQREAVFEAIGARLRAQLDDFARSSAAHAAGELGAPRDWPAELQVLHDVHLDSAHAAGSSAERPATTVKVPRHLALIFATPPPSFSEVAWEALRSGAVRHASRRLPASASALSLSERSARRAAERQHRRQAVLVAQTRCAVRWAALLGVEQLSVFDDQGLLKAFFEAERGAFAQPAPRAQSPALPQQSAWSSPGRGQDDSADYDSASAPDSSAASSTDDSERSASGSSAASQMASSASSLPSSLGAGADSLKNVSVSASSPGPASEGEAPAQLADQRVLVGGSASHQIKVELCLSGKHDVSFEMQQARRRGAVLERIQAASAGAGGSAAVSDVHAPQPAQEVLHITLNVLSAEDGKPELAGVARELRECVRAQAEDEVRARGGSEAERRAERREVRKLLLDRIDARKVDAALEGRGAMGEPELVIVKGGLSPRCTSLHGFPPWPLRLSEIHHCESLTHGEEHELVPDDLLNALLQYSGSTQRYGR